MEIIKKPAWKIADEKRLQNRSEVISYLLMLNVPGIRKHICISCKFSTLYDKNNKPYKIGNDSELELVKKIVEEIKQTNDKILDTSGNAAKS